MTSSRETNKALVTDLKEMEIYNLPDKEFKIIILKKLDERQNTGRQLNKIRKTMHEQKQKKEENTSIIQKKSIKPQNEKQKEKERNEEEIQNQLENKV